MLVAPDVPAWLARVGGLPDETRRGGHGKPRAACGPVEGRVIDDTTPTRRRAEGRQHMAERTRAMKPTGKAFFVVRPLGVMFSAE